jgi:hypothetical protein
VVSEVTDPVVLATIVQTAVLTLTLVIFIMSFRSQERSFREAAYQKVLDDYSDAIKLPLENPGLFRFQTELARTNPELAVIAAGTAEELALRNYVMLLYGLFERAHLLYRKKWIDKEAWDQWDAFLKVILKHPMFKDIHDRSQGMFDKPFQDYVSNMLNQKATTT